MTWDEKYDFDKETLGEICKALENDPCHRTRQNLDKATIERILKEIDGVDRLGQAYVSEVIAYPATGVDIVNAIRYILEKDVVGSFVNFLDTCKLNGLKPTHAEYEIPIHDKTQHGKSTLRILFSLSPNEDNSVLGRLYHQYSGQQELLSFLKIPKIK